MSTAQRSCGAFGSVLYLIEKQADCPEVLINATALLLALTNLDLPHQEFLKTGAIITLLKVAQSHLQHPTLVRNVLLILAAFAKLTG